MKKCLMEFANKYGESVLITSNSPSRYYPPIKEELKMRVVSIQLFDTQEPAMKLYSKEEAINDMWDTLVTEGEVFLCQVNERERLLFETIYLEDDVIDSLGLENPHGDMLWLVPLNPDVVLDPIPLVPFAESIIGSVKMKNFDHSEYSEYMLA